MQDADYRRIPLQRRDGFIKAEALVEASDYAVLSEWTWNMNNNGYAVRLEPVAANRYRAVLMHRYLLGLDYGDGREVDHINREKLDSRRANLRIVTRAQQNQNTPARRGAASRFRGVTYDKDRGMWRARVRTDGRDIALGRFEDEIAAARVAEAWRLTNFPYAEPDPELVRLDGV